MSYENELSTPEIQTQLKQQNVQHAAFRFAQLLESNRNIDIVDDILAPVVALDSRRDWHDETIRLQAQVKSDLRQAQA